MSPFVCSIANHHNRFIAAAVEEIVTGSSVTVHSSLQQFVCRHNRFVCYNSKHSDDEADEEDMDVEDVSDEEIVNALAVAQALGKSSETTNLETKYDDIAEGLKELDMDNYDNEDDGILILPPLI
ncbi:periodic tryptophan protein 1-like protein [Cucumis melo var. makuwa]|uniref:Periodic tryptophan protein 1-like protein n=2 Tax=Cucumis melo TaxID=3656 RepID=A0A5A7U9C7_CUCMM|nr:periodic tryptophan protein 1-like protein [Cucumis melo var. makuwa]